jgi:DNA-binding XRE family transcriptional regulator
MNNRLKELRQLHKWSQAELARKLGVSRQSVNGFESGKYDPSLDMAFKIASLFNVAIEEIFIYERTNVMPNLVEQVKTFFEEKIHSLVEVGVMTAEELLERYAAQERDFSNLYLIRLNIGGKYPMGANLSGINLSGANLSESDLRKVNLSGANLSGADLSNCSIEKANLSGANLSGANLNNTLVNESNLSGANLSGASLKNTQMTESNLSGADLTSANLVHTNLTGADLTDANLTNTHFTYAIGSNGRIINYNESLN